MIKQDLDLLIARARRITVSASDREKQRRSFAYGNANMANSRVTHYMVDAAAEQLAANHVVELCDEIDRLREENSALRNEVDRLRAIVEPLEKLARGNNHVQVEYTAGTADEWEVTVEQRWHVIDCHNAPTLADALRAACEAMGEG